VNHMHTAHPSISVIIPVGSLDPLLDAQLQALAEQDVDYPFDVLISDNAGDGRVSDHVASHPLRDRLQLTCVDASQQVGAAHARNRGAESASGDLLAFCDSDDVVHTSWLTTLVQKASSFDVVGTAVETVTLNSARALSWTPTTEPEKQGRTDFLPFAIGASMACWASVYRDLGGMDNRFRASQDVESAGARNSRVTPWDSVTSRSSRIDFAPSCDPCCVSPFVWGSASPSFAESTGHRGARH